MQVRVLRWAIPIDDQPHNIGGGAILLVAARENENVEVWTQEILEDDFPASEPVYPKRPAQVFGTGQPLNSPPGAFIGSCLSPNGVFVWHVYQVGPHYG